MPSRRGFLAGLAAVALSPPPSWADAGSPSFLAAARSLDGTFALYGLDSAGQRVFSVPLPERGHAAAGHPSRPEAVAFARRPGTFALVIDCRETGRLIARLDAPPGRHFYGHGAYSSDGALLFTTENAYEEGIGKIGVWDATDGYRRTGEIPSHGIGPHDLLRLPGTDILAIANGGIETHPASGRAKLNLGLMEPNLSYVSSDGALLDQVTLDPTWHMQSIRHLAARADGTVAAACQWQGAVTQSPALLFLHRRGGDIHLMQSTPTDHRDMEAYAGSVAFFDDGARVAITSPRGGQVQVFGSDTGAYLASVRLEDACGVASQGQRLCVTSGTGVIGYLSDRELKIEQKQPVQWDNHLVALGRGAGSTAGAR